MLTGSCSSIMNTAINKKNTTTIITTKKIIRKINNNTKHRTTATMIITKTKSVIIRPRLLPPFDPAAEATVEAAVAEVGALDVHHNP